VNLEWRRKMVKGTCPVCGGHTSFREEFVGRSAKCPHCGAKLHLTETGARAVGAATTPGSAPADDTRPGHVAVAGGGASPVSEGQQRTRHLLAHPLALAACGIVAAGALLWVVVWLARPDTWERDNAERIAAMLKVAAGAETADPVKAYSVYTDALAETSEHTITRPELKKQLEEAAQARDRLRPVAEARIAEHKKEEARRRAEERRKAEEAKRLAAEAARKVAAAQAEQERLAKERERRAETYPAYHRKIQAFQDALLRIRSDLEVGINISSYGERVREANFQYNKWTRLLDAKEVLYPSARLLEAALNRYVVAMKHWDRSIQGPKSSREREKLYMQFEWRTASTILARASACMSSRDVVKPMFCPQCLGQGKAGEGDSKATCTLCKGKGRFPIR